MDRPTGLATVDDVVAFLPELAGWAWRRDPSPDVELEHELVRVFGKPLGRYGVRRPTGNRAEPFPARVKPWDGALPDLSPPADGWARSTPRETARLASIAMSAARRASVARAVAGDPAARARDADAARTELETIAELAARAESYLAPSSSPWLARIGDYERSLPPAPAAIPVAQTDRRPIAGYTQSPVTLT